MLDGADINPALANKLVSSLASLRLNREGWATVARGDYQWNKAVLDESVAARENEGLRASRDPFARTVIESLLTLSPSVYSVKRNVLGDYWADLAERSIRIYQQTGRVSESLVSAVQGMVALKAFEGRLGRMPETLGELVPGYLDRVPLDFFDGRAIRYSQDRHLIYSVGSDLADAQGEWHYGEPCHAELRFPIPFGTKDRPADKPTRFTCGA
jgi:hypothetical protein